MDKQQFLEHLWASVERSNRGWVKGGEVPACIVLADGKRVDHVLAVHRKTGRIRIADQPLKVDKHRKRVISRTFKASSIQITTCQS